MIYPTKKLGEVLDYEQPTPYIVSSKSYSDEYETPVLTAGKSFILGKTKEKKGVFPSKDLPVIIFDDFTTATKFVDFPFKVKSSAMKILRPVRNVSDAKFIFYMMQNITFDHTGIHKRYWISEYSNFEVPVPSISEQRRVAKKLDEVFEEVTKAKEAAEKNLQNAKELFESYLNGVFTNLGKDWEEKKLGDILQKTETVDPTKKPNEEFVYIDVSSVNKETKIIENPSLIKGKDAPSRARKLVKTNDVIFATVRPTHGRVAVVTDEYNNQICSTGYFVLRTTEAFDNKLIFYFLLTSYFNKQMEKLQKGASYPAVTDSEVKAQMISYPKSIIEQKAIVKKLDALSAQTKKLEKIYEQKLADLEELKKSVLSKAFHAEL